MKPVQPSAPFLRVAVAVLSLLALHRSDAQSPLRTETDRWRAEHRLIDLHQHIDFSTQHLARAVKILDRVGLGLAVNLGTGTVTRGPGDAPSEFQRNKALADSLHPGRLLHYMILDYAGWDAADWSERAVRQIEVGHQLGAAGLKEFKRLGLYLRDGQNHLIRVDDPKLDPVWQRCGELGMPVSIHVADPKAFWLPYDERNERWNELRDHPSWWFGDSNKFPAWRDLLEALNRVIARHPKTTFVCVHFGNNAEELDWVDASLRKHPNMRVDLAARIPEIGRHDPEAVRRLFLEHQDRILFGTDFQVYDRLILGSSGNEPPPTDQDAEVFFQKHWRWLETRDRNWAHMTPIQGDWTIGSLGLPTPVLRKIYFDNARRLLARSLPAPTVRAARITRDFKPDGRLTEPEWSMAQPAWIDRASADGAPRADLATSVRVLWSDRNLYLTYECPFTRLTTFMPQPNGAKRYDLNRPSVSLWDRDVVEAFINSDPADRRRYAEFQVAPTNERLDLRLELPRRDFAWSSGFESAVRVDRRARVWRCELRIPIEALASVKPQAGTRWRLNLFRCDRANDAFLAWNPTLAGSFHVPERFGVLEFHQAATRR
jgi:predicted TIM-barrel fold metal-dependent hydrolase